MTDDDPNKLFGSMEGERVPGGCNDCDAYQVMEQAGTGVWRIVVHHDDWCPFWRGRRARR